MDLYSAARRLSCPFRFTSDGARLVPGLGDHGVIGDGLTAALVRVDGAIDWLCMPRFDSPSVFGALLDPDRGGLTAIMPARRPFESLQRYDPNTNVLETLFRIPEQGSVRLTDYMPWTDDPRASIHEIHRRIECTEGQVDLDVLFDPRFEYASGSTRLEITENGALAMGPTGERFVAVLGSGATWTRRPEGGVQARTQLRAGERRWLVLSWGAPRPEPITAYRPFEHLRRTRHAWREWSSRLQYDGPWRHHVVRSALVLKLLIYSPSGAMVAAPTTSLPETLGGSRNWDYRYTWIRDAALAIRAGNLIGAVNEAREFFHFVRDTLNRAKSLAVMYAVDGEPVPAERVLEHLSGYEGSRPVRIGNDARGQRQLDTAGALLDAAFLYERFGGSLSLSAWRHLRAVVEQVRESWGEPDHGIWETRNGIRHNVHSKLMSWVALDRGLRLSPLFGGAPEEEAWISSAAELRGEILREGLDPSSRYFVSTYRGIDVDASLLLVPIYGFLPPDDPRVGATIDRIRAELGSGGLVYRYRNSDGLEGREGAFLLCGFWLAEALALCGRLDEAQEVFVANAEASNHLGLLSEEIEPDGQQLIGNFPQAFSHMGLISAAARIDLALRLRDEGSGKVPRLLLIDP
jgi:GH15 family glucan-1,4-alpha-glucosidase